MLEGENDRLMDEMAEKIDTLKSVSNRLIMRNFKYIVSSYLLILGMRSGVRTGF